MELKLKKNIPQLNVPRDITMVPVNIIDARILSMYNEPEIMNSTVYYNPVSAKGTTDIWHRNVDGTWDCVTVSG